MILMAFVMSWSGTYEMARVIIICFLNMAVGGF